MHVTTTVADMHAARSSMPGVVGVVPTMGFLHEGHLSLVRAARAECDHVVVTIFVNPAQFGLGEDLDRYPRDPERDLALLREALSGGSGFQPDRLGGRGAGDHLVFAPSVDEIYPPGFDDWVEVHGPLTERLEGKHRPGHFRGVTTVVARLFRIICPDRAYFGQKDAQQLRVIRRMVQEQAIPVEIVAMPIVREPDGLAMSSRNDYLTPEQRRAALILSRSLREVAAFVRDGASDAVALCDRVRAAVLAEPLVTLDYVSVADETTLDELEIIDRPALILLAARVGATRLIDNTLVVPEGASVREDLRPLLESDAGPDPSLGP